jgi:excisionase family DNA binding protein
MNTPERLYKVEEVLKMLSISRTAFYREKNDGKIKTVNIGRAVRIKSSDLQNYVESLEMKNSEVK